MTDRELLILDYLTKVRISSTNQIQNLFFKGLHHSVSYRVLNNLIDAKLIKRKYFRVNNKNTHIYFLDKAPAKRNINHDLLITEMYVQLIKNDFDITYFERTPILAGIVPDAIIRFKKNNSEKHIFLEVQKSSHNCTDKYFNIKNKIKDDCPSVLYIITDQDLKHTEIRDLKVVKDGTDFHKLNFYFS